MSCKEMLDHLKFKSLTWWYQKMLCNCAGLRSLNTSNILQYCINESLTWTTGHLKNLKCLFTSVKAIKKCRHILINYADRQFL